MKKSLPAPSLPEKHRVVLAAGGGVAVYKAVEVASRLSQEGIEVDVLMTAAAQKFVAPLSFEAVTRRRVLTTMFPTGTPARMEDIFPHIFPAQQADLFAVLPATADLIAKIASGISDDIVCASAAALRPETRRVFCPAMNRHMWESAQVQTNTATLERLGWLRIGPEKGMLACNTQGPGRLAAPETIVREILALLAVRRTLAGKRVLILSGPTREYLDPVRYVGNASSGLMGQALAQAAIERGAQVDFVTGPVSSQNLPNGQGLTIFGVTSAQEMLKTARPLFAQADIAVFAAAVADYTPERIHSEKIKKHSAALTLRLVPTPDIASELGKNRKKGQILVGFALETTNARRNAVQKLQAKNLDFLLLNTPAALGAPEASFCLFSRTAPSRPENWETIGKSECARKLFEKISAS